MFILRSILLPLQANFSDSKLGQKRAAWFIQTLLAVIVPFTSSMTANLLRTVRILFDLDVTQRRFYIFMASPKLPWQRLWCSIWGMIPDPLTDGRIVLALDDFINPKTGKQIFGCATVFDHAAKANQSKYPWAQNVVSLGLLQQIKERWACLPLAARFYLPQKAVANKTANMKQGEHVIPFQTKLAQAVGMLEEVAKFFSDASILAVTDSWFGNNGLLKPARKAIGIRFHLLSRLRSNAVLYAKPMPKIPGQRGRPRKYGRRLGSSSQLAAKFRDLALTYTVDTYGKRRTIKAFSQVLMLKTFKCPVRVVWVFRRTQWVALFSTDLTLTVKQIIEFYAARWKIEAAFKELKQEIGSRCSQARNAYAVTNHLNFCMMAMTVTWIYAAKLATCPQRRHKVKGRTSFAFSDLRRTIAKVALSDDLAQVLPTPHNPTRNPLVSVLLGLAA